MVNTLQTEDAVVRQTLATLQGHIDTMLRACTNIEDINTEVHDHFQAACSTAYQQKINDWTTRYRQLRTSYDTFQQSFAAGHQIISTAHNEALDMVHGTSPSSLSLDVSNGLNPK
ncbi:hypothetical protein [Streptomyces sp. NRRL S-350]|uniref:hypothetical protein n=1 Tax=Streptomyces sp. NRRL S-350 TaxID=1463902 RepID=UPI0004C0A462|nr:hypothetical protein [Streptomyces sp. NRRL S-350]